MKKYNKQCLHCSSEFQTAYYKQKFCSDKCRSKAGRLRYERTCNELAAEFLSDPNANITNGASLSLLRLRFSILARDGFRCRYCGRSASDENVRLTVDHIFPKSHKGSDSQSNLITACQDCNAGKGDLILLTRSGMIPSYLSVSSVVGTKSSHFT